MLVVSRSNWIALLLAAVCRTSATCVTSPASIPNAFSVEVRARVVVDVSTIMLPAESTATLRMSIASADSKPVDTMPRRAIATSAEDLDVSVEKARISPFKSRNLSSDSLSTELTPIMALSKSTAIFAAPKPTPTSGRVRPIVRA